MPTGDDGRRQGPGKQAKTKRKVGKVVKLRSESPYWIEQKRRRMFVVEKIEELMLKKGWNKAKLAKMSGMAQSNLTGLMRGRIGATFQMVRRLADGFGVSEAVFDPDPKRKFRAKLIKSVMAVGVRKTAADFDVSTHILRRLVGEDDAFGEAIRKKAKAFAKKNPEMGPATFSEQCGVHPVIVREHCKGIFKEPAARIPLKARGSIGNAPAERIDGNNGFRVLLLLINGMAESDIAAGIGCSDQYIYHVRTEAIKSGFTFL